MSVRLAFPHEALKPEHIIRDRTHHALRHSGHFRRKTLTSAASAQANTASRISNRFEWASELCSQHPVSHEDARPLSVAQRQSKDGEKMPGVGNTVGVLVFAPGRGLCQHGFDADPFVHATASERP